MIYKNFLKKVLNGDTDIAFEDSETGLLETTIELEALVFSVLKITNKLAEIRVEYKHNGEIIGECFRFKVSSGDAINIKCDNNFKCSTKLKLIR